MRGTFRTNTGYCHVLDEHIVMNGFPELDGGEEAPVQPWKDTPFFFIYAMGGIVALIFSWILFQKDQTTYAGIAAIVGVLLLQVVIRLIRRKPQSGIPVGQVVRVRYFKGNPPITKAYFIVYFLKENGRKTHKIIALPYTKTAAFEEGEIAIALFGGLGLDVEHG